MMTSNVFVATLAIVLGCLCCAFIAFKKRIRPLFFLAAAALLFQALFCLSFGMGGLRPHIDIARESGKGREFVQGMIERDRFFSPPRMALTSCIAGLYFIIAVVGNAYFSAVKNKTE